MTALSLMPGQSYGEAVSWMDSTEEEVAAWMSMIENPNHWIDATLPIRTNLARRSEWLSNILRSNALARMHVAIMVGLKQSHIHIRTFNLPVTVIHSHTRFSFVQTIYCTLHKNTQRGVSSGIILCLNGVDWKYFVLKSNFFKCVSVQFSSKD